MRLKKKDSELLKKIMKEGTVEELFIFLFFLKDKKFTEKFILSIFDEIGEEKKERFIEFLLLEYDKPNPNYDYKIKIIKTILNSGMIHKKFSFLD